MPLGLFTMWLLTSCGGGTTDPDPTIVASVLVSASGATTVPIGGTVQLQASVRNAAGQPIAGVQVTWASQNSGVATVSPTGLVTGAGIGSALITASAGGRSGQVTVLVEDRSPPAAPSNLQGTVVSNTRIDLTWTDNSSNELSFRIERETGAGGPSPVPGAAGAAGPLAVFTEVATVGAGVTSFSDAALQPATTYRYRVRACNTNGCSDFTPTVERT
ncbi:MAG TPA: Ig-like domain-containing protein, partial [Gemmatimonadales bacterium]|nr:Ig-like domain-containing protein [Gemmatimonadales bacterium]